MGQFYKGTEATFLDDAMFKLPYEQMQQALQAKDTAIGNTIQSAIKLGDFDVAHHIIDREDAARVKQDWQNKIDATVNKVLENPMEYKSIQGDIISLGRDLTKDMKFGDISTLGARKSQIEEYQKGLEELYKKDPKQYAHQSALFARELSKAKNATYKNAETGEYNYFSGEGLLAAPAVTDMADAAIKDATGKEFESLRVTEDGQWKRTRGGKEEGWSDLEIKKMFINYANGNPVLLKGLQQSVDLGMTPEDWAEQGLAYMKEKYKVRTTGSTIKDEAGVQTTLAWTDAYNQEKEEKEQPIINSENIVSNLTNTYATYKTQINRTTQDFNNKKQQLAEIWNKANPNSKIDFKTAKVGDLIDKLSELEKTSPGTLDYSAEKEALKQQSIKLSIARNSESNYKTFLKTNKYADTKEAFKLWAEKVNNSKVGGKNYNLEEEVKVTWQGIGASKEERTGVQDKAFAQFPTMPFNLKGFKLNTVVNGQKAVAVFPTSVNDPHYQKLVTAHRKIHGGTTKINPNGQNTFKGKDGVLYVIDTRGMNKGGTATFSGELKDWGYVKAAPTIQTTQIGEASVSTTVPRYLIAGTNQEINFEKETYAPKHAAGSNNQTVYQGTARVGDQTLTLEYDSKGKNVVTSPSANQFFDKNKNSFIANKTIRQYSGTGNMNGSANIGGEDVKLINGVFQIPASNKGGYRTIDKDNALYNEYMAFFLEQKALQNK